ncbi:MAG: hypothetical protein CMI53_00985 [Parcubacteria group bacterium]|jgi:hypothetical protein|nr:hypothetical protein [Parcubacteria group bacterium]|tara:strand:+ start:14000 stop:14452 length:453 start_codon:yes stop_codon:yes gene_type:complete
MEKEINPTIQKRQDKNKGLIIEQLKKTPVIEIACKKVGIGRATYYRWKKDDIDFAEKAGISLEDGLGMISDLAESKLISAIQDENMTAIIFWLKSHRNAYRNRVELSTSEKPKEELTPEQQQAVEKALTLGQLTDDHKENQDDKDNIPNK